MTTPTDIKGDNQTGALRDTLRAFLEQITDPKHRKNVSDFIYESDPRSKAADFSSYPIIYIEDYSLETQDVNVGGNLFSKEITLEFHVVVSDDSQEQRAFLDDISDNIQYQAEYGDRKTFAQHGIGQPTVNRDQRFTGIDRADQPVLRKEFEIIADTQIDMEQTGGDNPYA